MQDTQSIHYLETRTIGSKPVFGQDRFRVGVEAFEKCKRFITTHKTVLHTTWRHSRPFQWGPTHSGICRGIECEQARNIDMYVSMKRPTWAGINRCHSHHELVPQLGSVSLKVRLLIHQTGGAARPCVVLRLCTTLVSKPVRRPLSSLHQELFLPNGPTNKRSQWTVCRHNTTLE